MDGTRAPITGRPRSLLICAMGGEGGGVLTGWVVAAAQGQGLAVQATSVPGVAQRTGGTTYYIEMAPSDPAGRTPVFALTPVAGEVDVVLASELAEAARAARLGFLTPDRSALIASTHRVFLIQEKMAMSDGRLDPAELERSARARAKRAVTFDMERIAEASGAPISAVMLGALAGAGVLPIERRHFEQAIRDGKLAVERNLAAFAAAANVASRGSSVAPHAPKTVSDFIIEPQVPGDDQLSVFPTAAHATIALGLKRLTEYQDDRYAALYRQRLQPFSGLDPGLCREVARHLALRMSYEDVIRVAQLKASTDRFARIGSEVGASPDDPFEVQDFFKPGIHEIADVLPPRLARALLALSRRSKRIRDFHVGMRLRTTTVTGYARILMLAKLRSRRRGTYRYAIEQAAIEAWLGLVTRAAGRGDISLALEIAELARLIRGYGDTHARGLANYNRIVDRLIEPALTQPTLPAGLAGAVRSARTAALTDPEGETLTRVLAELAGEPFKAAAIASP